MAKDAKDPKYEAKLYKLYLELAWGVDLRADQVSDLESELKEAKAHLKTDKKLLQQVTEKYTEIFGTAPRTHKKI